ncbi:MAG: hypothetical protein MI923_25235 [Phycisphaerales bacterium]|nr:hypothetical protein [Phycisphaerales bacterium]
MARIQGVEKKKAGFLVRLAYFMTRRKVGRVVTPVKIYAHHPRLLRAYAHMEMGQEAAQSIEPQLKTLASVEVARRIGCPF